MKDDRKSEIQMIPGEATTVLRRTIRVALGAIIYATFWMAVLGITAYPVEDWHVTIAVLYGFWVVTINMAALGIALLASYFVRRLSKVRDQLNARVPDEGTSEASRERTFFKLGMAISLFTIVCLGQGVSLIGTNFVLDRWGLSALPFGIQVLGVALILVAALIVVVLTVMTLLVIRWATASIATNGVTTQSGERGRGLVWLVLAMFSNRSRDALKFLLSSHPRVLVTRFL